MNGFKVAGQCPFNPGKVLQSGKLLSSLQFSDEKQPDHTNTIAFKKVIGQDRLNKFEERCEEGYDIASDELCFVWKEMKKLSLDDEPPIESNTEPISSLIPDPM